MKIAVIGSNGRVAKSIINEAKARGDEVTGFAREESENVGIHFIKKNALDLTKEDLLSFDVVIDAVGGWTEDTIPNITLVMKHLADILSNTSIRLMVVGGAGSLYVNHEHTLMVDQGADFPESWKPLSSAHGEGLSYLRKSKNLLWTYISPACNFVFEGEKTGTYQLGGEELILSANGESMISYSDYALAFVDVLHQGNHLKERISVVSK